MPIAVLAVAAVGYAWWVTELRPFSGLATAAVLAGGLAALALGRILLPSRPAVDVDAADLARWGLVVAALVAWQLAAWASEPRSDHPTLSSVANGALDARPLRAAALVAWLVGAARLGRR